MIIPVGNRVLVIQDIHTQEHRSGLILTSDTVKHQSGLVVAVGTKADPGLNGKKVLFPKGIGAMLRIEPTDYLLVNVDDLFVVIE